MSVAYRLVRTGRTEHEIVERLVPTTCPTCAADWTKRQAVTSRHEGGRVYRCSTCTEYHRGVLVDDDGRPVPTPGWGLSRDQQED